VTLDTSGLSVAAVVERIAVLAADS